VAGRFDRNLTADLFVIGYAATLGSLLLGTGDGSFGVIQRYAVDNIPVGIASGDFDHDLWADLVTTGTSEVDLVTVRLNRAAHRNLGPRCPADIDGDAFATAHDFVILA